MGTEHTCIEIICFVLCMHVVSMAVITGNAQNTCAEYMCKRSFEYSWNEHKFGQYHREMFEIADSEGDNT